MLKLRSREVRAEAVDLLAVEVRVPSRLAGRSAIVTETLNPSRTERILAWDAATRLPWPRSGRVRRY